MALQGQYARNKARRNRNVNANIDETLFGARTSSNSRRGVHGRASRVEPTGRTGAEDTKNSTVISLNELGYIKNTSVIITEAERQRRKQEIEALNEKRQANARARKAKMLKMEEDRRSQAPDLTESEQIELKENNEMLAHAQACIDEQNDDVKQMNSMMLYAKCATIRDAQIREKQRMQEMIAEEERRQDTIMEIDRIKTLKMHAEREQKRGMEQKVGAQVIIQQIQEREAERIRQQELREIEAQAMLQRIRELEIKEEEEKQQKVIAGRKMLEQVMAANQAQARAKLATKQQELEEDQRIAEYLRAQEVRMAAEDAEKERIRAAKDAEHHRMLLAQEKILDDTGAMDELRAKRYQEAKEREWRKTQLAVAKKQSALKEDINRVRKQQMSYKAQAMAEQALRDQEEFTRVVEWQAAQNEIEKQQSVELQIRANAHKNDVLSQIAQHESEKIAARKQFLTEGRKIQVNQAREKARLERIKQQKMTQLMQSGVPEKYCTELAKKQVLVNSLY